MTAALQQGRPDSEHAAVGVEQQGGPGRQLLHSPDNPQDEAAQSQRQRLAHSGKIFTINICWLQ